MAEEWDVEIKNEKRFRLNQINLKPKDKFIYEYDFGDNWRHEILFERILPFEQAIRYPKCIDGKRSRPPEDVGGIYGYEYFLEAVSNPRHPDHKDLLIWAGEEFDAEYFSLDETNERLWKTVKSN